MKAARPYPKIIITPKGEAALTGGHPWVYEGEVTAVDGAAEDGGLVDEANATTRSAPNNITFQLYSPKDEDGSSSGGNSGGSDSGGDGGIEDDPLG